MTTDSKYLELRKIDVGQHIEKKNNLSYLSWAWAVDVLLQQDPLATWEYKEPAKFGETLMVFCSVTAFGKTMTAQLPVMDFRNKAIANPDAFSVNTAMQRCLAKAIALHGLGLYIYAGEDLPDNDKESKPKAVESQPMAMYTVTPEQDLKCKEIAMEIVDFATKELWDDAFVTYDNVSDHDERIAVWTHLKPNSSIRTKLKAMGEAKRQVQGK